MQKNKLLLLQNRAKNIICIFHEKCSVKLQLKTIKKLLNVSGDHKVSNNVS